ncbi:MAG: T9SS type A sorting domain-containing protein [Fibrobacteres bacterium]|nr:T9SS type A sorting domain-containing protein [Fibrobacterota bacterium]
MKSKATLILLILFSLSIYSEVITTLKIKERSSVARVDEVVTCGVPLPLSGQYRDSSKLVLRDENNNPVACQFRPASKWWQDKSSIRWLHLNFQMSTAADAEKTYTLCREDAPPTLSTPKLTVTDEGTKFTVVTGPLKLTVKKANFNLFDEVWVDETGAGSFDNAHKVVASHNKGFSLLSGGQRYYSSNDAASTAVIEKNGNRSVTLRCDGLLKNNSGTSLFWYRTRITFYDNSKVVNVQFSFENRNPEINTKVAMSGLNCELPLVLSQRQFAIGAPTAPKTGTITAGQNLVLTCHKLDKFKFSGAVVDSGNPRDGMNPKMGWMAQFDGTKGAAVALKYMMQMYPSCLMQSDTSIIVGMFSHVFTGGATTFPPRNTTYYDIYSGMSRTHDIRFSFFNNDLPSEIQGNIAGIQTPLFPVAPAEWYTNQTECIARLTPAGDFARYGSDSTLVSKYERFNNQAFLKCIGNTNTLLGGKDAYDYLGWGDNPHEFTTRLLWNGNYYDLPYLHFTHFLRNLDFRFMDYAVAHAGHIRDLHIVHYDATNTNDGGNRYCPPTNHIGADATTPNIQDHSSHHKTQSLFINYYMTGDLRSLDVAFKGNKWVVNRGVSGTTYVMDAGKFYYARRPAHNLFTLSYNYRQTLNRTDSVNMMAHWNAIKPMLISDPQPGTDFLIGLLTEAVVDVYNTTGDTSCISTLKNVADKLTQYTCNSAFAFAWLWKKTGNPLYRTKMISALAYIDTWSTLFGHHEKDFAVEERNLTRVFSELADVANGISTEKKPEAVKTVNSIDVTPNPFNSATVINLANIDGFNAKTCKVTVYDSNGKLIADLSKSISSGKVMLSAKGRTCGVYYIKADIGNGKALKTKVLLLK